MRRCFVGLSDRSPGSEGGRDGWCRRPRLPAVFILRFTEESGFGWTFVGCTMGPKVEEEVGPGNGEGDGMGDS